MVRADHSILLGEAAWDEVAGWILAFMAGGPGAPIEGFDEAFYLQAYPDVAEALAAGRFRSGLDHFEQIGRRKGRSWRLVAPGG